ncbi:MAG TPA: hypothetical protein VIH25_11050 [Steroidobacteraceae bacterium]
MKVCIAASLMLLAACGREPSAEERIREVIAAAETAAEARDLSDVMALVSDRYSDLRGQDKAAIRDLMRGYFLINQSIHLLLRIEDLEFPANNMASARVTVGMLGRQDAGGNDWSLAADVYEFEIRLLNEDDEWRLISAEWVRAGRGR